MTTKELIAAIALKYKEDGFKINKPASLEQIKSFEKRMGFKLPNDFKELYLICNGFECNEDIFNIIPLEDIESDKRHYGKDWFHFSEYMIYCDMWSLRVKTDTTYEIFNASNVDVILANSLNEFFEKFLEGGVFEEGGLYDWCEQIKKLQISIPKKRGTIFKFNIPHFLTKLFR